MDQRKDQSRKSIFLVVIVPLFLSPFAFQLLKLSEPDIALLVAIAVSLILIVTISVFIEQAEFERRYHAYTSTAKSPNRNKSRETNQILGLFSSIASSFYNFDDAAKSPKNDRGHQNQGLQQQEQQQQDSKRPRIDPKYFKPKFLFNELMEICGTTYTVITWGSFYLIGGTVVATERLARKIKTKCTRANTNDTHNSSSGTGRADSFMSQSSRDEQRRNESRSKMFSYTKVKRRISKYINTSTPRMSTSMAALGPDTSSNTNSSFNL